MILKVIFGIINSLILIGGTLYAYQLSPILGIIAGVWVVALWVHYVLPKEFDGP